MREVYLLKNERQSLTNEIWLNYYNSYLFERGIITETERNKMKNLIHQNCHGKKKFI